MLQELEDKLTTHDAQIKHLQKSVSMLTAKIKFVGKLTYTVKEASEALGVKATTIRSWIDDGKLKATKVGKNIFIPADNLLKLINP